MTGRRPFEGITVLDMTHVLAGPYATYLLALLGARVVRIEPPGGESYRYRSGSDAARRVAGMATGHIAQGANKESVCLDLKSAEGHAAFLDLLAGADVLVDNFQPGTLERLGLGPAIVGGRNPGIIHCSLSGYAPEDSRAGWPAYDNVIQAASGLMAVTGTTETGPLKCGAPIVDYGSGMMLAFTIVTALFNRAQGETGPQRVQVSMQETAQALMTSIVTDHLATGRVPSGGGNKAGSGMPASGTFETADGLLALAANEPHQIAGLMRTLGLDGPGAGAADWDAEAWRAYIEDKGPAVALALRQRPAAEWEALLNAAEVPAARVRGFAEAVGETVGSGSPFICPGATSFVTAPFRFVDGAGPRIDRVPPPAGLDTDRVLHERREVSAPTHSRS